MEKAGVYPPELMAWACPKKSPMGAYGYRSKLSANQWPQLLKYMCAIPEQVRDSIAFKQFLAPHHLRVISVPNLEPHSLLSVVGSPPVFSDDTL
jgi:hypothetical protein